MSKGYIYILSNESMPDIYKIGRSIKSGRERAKQLYSGATGVPTEFKLEFEVLCKNCVEAEMLVHERLDHIRINDNREFFKDEHLGFLVKEVMSVVIESDDRFNEVLAITSPEIAYFEEVLGQFGYKNNTHPMVCLSYVTDLLSTDYKQAFKRGREIHEERCRKRKVNIRAI